VELSKQYQGFYWIDRHERAVFLLTVLGFIPGSLSYNNVLLKSEKLLNTITKIGLLILITLVWALLFNSFSANGIALIGKHEDYKVKPAANDIFLQSVREKFDYGLAIFLDCRSTPLFEEGHIPGALSIPSHEFDDLLPGFLSHCSIDYEYITYCDGTDCDSSVIVANNLKSMGFVNVHIFFGGWNEWVKAGFPVEKGKALDLLYHNDLDLNGHDYSESEHLEDDE